MTLLQQGHLVDLAQREVKALLQAALDVALSVVRANPTVLEGLGAYLEGNFAAARFELYIYTLDERNISLIQE